MKTFKKQMFLFFITVVLGSLLCLGLYFHDNKYTREGAQPVDGLLILSQEELEQNSLHYLVNGWAFYPDKLLTPSALEIEASQDYMFYTSIGEHTNFSEFNSEDSPHGSGSYLLHIRLPEQIDTYALTLPEIYSAYKLYINDELALQMGNPDPGSYEPLTQNRMVTFRAGGEVTILLAVSDYSHFYSGLVYPPAFGSPLKANIMRGAQLGITISVVIIGIIGAILSLYLSIRMKHTNALIFSLLCLTAALSCSYPLIHTYVALPIQPWYALEIAFGYLLTLFVIFLHNQMCEVDDWIQYVSILAAALFCLLALCYGLFSSHLTLPVMRIFSVLVFIFKAGTALYLLTVSFLSLNTHRKVAPLFYASALYATFLAWDRILPEYEPILTGWFPQWGSLVFCIAIGYTLWHDIVTAYSYNLSFAEEHRQITRQLDMQIEYANQISGKSEENRRQLHDFRQHLRTITGIVSQIECEPAAHSKKEELLEYLAQIPEVSAPRETASVGAFSNHVAIDALLQYYYAAASKHAIRAELSLYLPEGIPLSDVQFCTILGNLLENAVDGCKRQGENERFIQISVKQTADTFFIKIENSYDGKYNRQGEHFLSRKAGTIRFGIGLESVHDLVCQAGGTLDVYPMETVFRVGISLPVVS
ncbi:MAG: GHKL domain-containing protein [Hespellia sp.]|nr:GHKL domain-containing protein [Hespellia sp.]